MEASVQNSFPQRGAHEKEVMLLLLVHSYENMSLLDYMV